MDAIAPLIFTGASLLACVILSGRRNTLEELEERQYEENAEVVAKNSSLFKLDKNGLHRLKPDALAALKARDNVHAPQTRKRLFTVCLTGGPCSGKSTSLASLSQALTARGFDVYAVPEVPTIVMNAGFPYPGLEGGELLMEFELALARSQLQLEDNTVRLGRARDRLQRHRPCVVFFDRGLIDMKAYMTPEMWTEMLHLLSLHEDEVLDRYDMVLHLQTSAFGAEMFYTTANNAVRTEGLEEARTNDTRVKTAWEAHPNWRHVPNRPGQGFSQKIEEATAAVLELCGCEPLSARRG